MGLSGLRDLSVCTAFDSRDGEWSRVAGLVKGDAGLLNLTGEGDTGLNW